MFVMDEIFSRKCSQEEDEIRPMPVCAKTPYSLESDIADIIGQAEQYINTLYGHKLEEGVECNNRRVLGRSISRDDDICPDKGGVLRTEISAAQLKKQEGSLIAGREIIYT